MGGSYRMNLGSNLSAKTIAKLRLFLMKKESTVNAVEVANDYFDNELKARIDNEKIFYRDFPTELEALADNEFIYNLLIETYNQAFFTGYKAGATDLERLINMCDE